MSAQGSARNRLFPPGLSSHLAHLSPDVLLEEVHLETTCQPEPTLTLGDSEQTMKTPTITPSPVSTDEPSSP